MARKDPEPAQATGVGPRTWSPGLNRAACTEGGVGAGPDTVTQSTVDTAYLANTLQAPAYQR